MIVQHLLPRSVVIQRHLHHINRHAVASLLAAACTSAALVCSGDVGSGTSEKRILYRRASPSTQICECEKNDRAAPPSSAAPITHKPLSRIALLLYPHSYLPVPRLITANDPLFSYPALKRGLVRRHNDEERVRQILSSPEVTEARKTQDPVQMQNILKQMNSIVYGDGVTPQKREDFLMQYGCTGFTDSILQYLVDIFGQRGIIEVGAGNGQWARALSDLSQKEQNKNSSNTIPKSWEFILAYDNMEQLPLSPKVYHKNTVPAKKYFYSKVQQCTHIDAVQKSRGRALLLVYPPPGPMALETVLAYIEASPGYHDAINKNDTVIYVGEGIGGANADDAFFDYFLGRDDATENEDKAKSQWVLDKVMDVHTCPGGKGYEKMFVFRRK
ncbi:hypothetical protein ACHAXR_011477 [Thalassiosira sp. AJA248-18]